MTSQDSPGGTRGGIMELLKRSGGLTANELGDRLGVTAMAARQHLAVLTAEGLVESSPRRDGVGRPSSIFRLTEKGHETFPRLYDEFLLLVLRGLKELQGAEGLERLLDWRTELYDRELGDKLRQYPPRERVHRFFDVITETGHMAELHESGDDSGEITIVEHNCPIARVSREFPEICSKELVIFERVLGLPVARDRCMAHGANECRYRILLRQPN